MGSLQIRATRINLLILLQGSSIDDFGTTINLSNIPVSLFAATRKELFDTHNQVTDYTYSLEVCH